MLKPGRVFRSAGRVGCVAIAAAAMAACVSCGPAGSRRAAGENPEWALLDQPPGDFTLSVTVYPPDGAAAGTAEGELPRYLRGMRALVEPDLSLRAKEGRLSPRTYPAMTRTLSPEQYRRLWWDLRDSGLLREGHPDEVASADWAAPTTDTSLVRGLYIISYVAAGHHRTVAIDPMLSEDAPGVRLLVDRVAALAWIE